MRAVLLGEYLLAEAQLLDSKRPVGRAVIGAGLLGGAVALGTQSADTLSGPEAWAPEHVATWRWPVVATLGSLGAVEFAAFAMSDELQWAIDDFWYPVFFLGAGAAWQVGVGHTPRLRASTGAVFGTGVVMAAMEFLNLEERQRARAEIRKTLVRLKASDKRLTFTGLARAERVLDASTHSMGYIMALGGVGVVGTLVAALPALLPGATEEERSAALAVALTEGMFVAATAPIMIATGSSYTRYTSVLSKLKFAPVGPQGTGGVTIGFRF